MAVALVITFWTKIIKIMFKYWNIQSYLGCWFYRIMSLFCHPEIKKCHLCIIYVQHTIYAVHILKHLYRKKFYNIHELFNYFIYRYNIYELFIHRFSHVCRDSVICVCVCVTASASVFFRGASERVYQLKFIFKSL